MKVDASRVLKDALHLHELHGHHEQIGRDIVVPDPDRMAATNRLTAIGTAPPCSCVSVRYLNASSLASPQCQLSSKRGSDYRIAGTSNRR